MSHSEADREVRTTVLPNGIRVISEAMPAVRSVAFGFWLGTGSRIEKPAESGISHFIEHMLFKGTPKRNAEAIAREMDSIGGHLDAFTGRELVGYNAKVLDEHLPLAFDILADMLLHPLFDAEEIEKEKGVILEELKMDTDNPESFIHDLFVSRFWHGHPIGMPIIGTKRTIRGFTSDALAGFHRRFYQPANLTLTAAGSLEHERLVELAGRYLGGLQSQDAAPAADKPVATPPILLKSRRSLEQVHFCLGTPFIDTVHPMRYAAYTLNVVLGAGMSSRLFQNIREKRGLAYSIFSELNLYRDTGMLAVYAGASASNIRPLLEGVMTELRRLKSEPLAPDELRLAKDHMKGSLVLSLESTGSRMSNLARQWLSYGRFYSVNEILEGIEAVTAGEVRDLAAAYFHTDNIGLALLGRLDGLEMSRENLEC
jgi:predicted Zn-dependent peptidase